MSNDKAGHEARYSLEFTGTLSPDKSVDDVVGQLGALFKLPPDRARAFAFGGSRTVRKGLDASSAQSLCRLLSRTGGIFRVVPEGPVEVATIAPSVESEGHVAVAPVEDPAAEAAAHVETPEASDQHAGQHNAVESPISSEPFDSDLRSAEATEAHSHLRDWYRKSAKPFLVQHAPDRIEQLENEWARLDRLLALPDRVTVCFLGNSGIGKSTLLNALAAGAEHVLPAGGIGPLTAQAAEVSHSENPRFRVTYHRRNHLWKVAFALETFHHNEIRGSDPSRVDQSDSGQSGKTDDFAQLLEDEERDDVVAKLANENPEAPSGGRPEVIEQMFRQAKLIVTGNQFASVSLPYVIDGLRIACDVQPRWGESISEEDQRRLLRVRQIHQLTKENRSYQRQQSGDEKSFLADLRDHAAGFIAPLIQQISVGWPSEVLASGIELVDLPGVGIAQDTYRDITKKYIREKARAVIVVVDRAGPTETTVDLLRSSGYWDRLVGSADDPASDPCTMMIAVTRVDDVAWSAWREMDPDVRPKRREVFVRTVEEFKPRMRDQIADQLGRIGASSNQSVQEARSAARANILRTLEVHPVSAPEFAKILRGDEDEPSTLKDVEETGVPRMRESLKNLGHSERARRAQQIDEVAERLSAALISELRIINAQWRGEGRAADEAQRLEAALSEILQKKREEYDRRVGAFRESLNKSPG